MLFHDILVPFDGSDHSRRALDIACNFYNASVCCGETTKIHVVKIVEPPENVLIRYDDSSGFGMAGMAMSQNDFIAWRQSKLDEDLVTLQNELSEIGDVDAISDGNLTVEVVPETSFAESITEAAAERDCDVIIMGSRGLGALRGVLGSVSYGVLRASKIPVLITK
jgi:nucleotide-binding universal stress UspA family protein